MRMMRMFSRNENLWARILSLTVRVGLGHIAGALHSQKRMGANHCEAWNVGGLMV